MRKPDPTGRKTGTAAARKEPIAMKELEILFESIETCSDVYARK